MIFTGFLPSLLAMDGQANTHEALYAVWCVCIVFPRLICDNFFHNAEVTGRRVGYLLRFRVNIVTDVLVVDAAPRGAGSGTRGACGHELS